MKTPSHQEWLRIEGDNYKQTVLGLCAFANEMLFDDESRKVVAEASVHCGRRFKTSAHNRRSASTEVTPDLAVVRRLGYAVVAEAKLGFEADPACFAARVREAAAQVEKYDDDLSGWPATGRPGGKFPRHDLVLIVNFEDAKRAVKALAGLRQKGQFNTTRRFAIVSVLRMVRAEGEWPVLSLEDGALSDDAKTTKLESRIPIRPELIQSNPHIGLAELCDHPPPLPLMMFLVHKAIAENLTLDENEQYNIEGQVDKAVTLGDLKKWLSIYAFKRADSKDPAIPPSDWIAKAVGRLVKMEWMERAAGAREAYLYHHKKGRKGSGDPYGRFIEVCAKDLSQEDEKRQKKADKERAKGEKEKQKYKKNYPLFAPLIDREGRTDGPPSSA